MEYKIISEDEFDTVYKPQRNRWASKDSAYDGCLYETYGKELERVRAVLKLETGRIWTLLDDGTILSGAHSFNRLGFFITKKAVADGEALMVPTDDPREWDDSEDFVGEAPR